MDRIKRIKEKYSVLDYARGVLNLPVRKSGDRACSLVQGSKNPTALVIYDNFWYDFKLGMGGDVIDLCACVRHNGDKGAAIRELGGEFTGGDWVRYTQELNCKIQKWHEDLRESDMSYLSRRRIKKATVDRLKIGFDGERLVIPYWKNGYIAYYITRERDGTGPKYKKAKLDDFNENIPWGLHTLNPETKKISSFETGILDFGTENSEERIQEIKDKTLVITEGVFDALSFEQEGYKVLSPMGGYFNKEALRQVINICQGSEDVFLCFDSDDSGNSFQIKMSKVLFSNRVKFHCGKLNRYKDISEYYEDGRELAELITDATDGIEELAARVTDRDDFKTFILSAARFAEKTDLVELFEKTEFPKAWLDQLKKAALSAPSDKLIINELLDERRLKYFEALGFYEYIHGVWKKRGDYEVRALIGDLLGHYLTGPRVNSVLTALKGEVVSTEMLNQQDIFNFRNCVLDLKTGETMEHSESFMSSIQVDYDYDRDAYSPEWAQFMEDISGGDESKIKLLQEVAGYVLFTDNSLQKCFFLMGAGANGKSVFLDVLSAVFGEDNVSSIEMSGLAEPFQRIHLLTSIVNISTETKSNVNGAESVFKQIVVGDAISGCYKNKDFLNFRPRTKLITACNEYIKSRDTTAGFMRRICFISFNERFVDNPQDGEYKADKNLYGKLRNNLSAVFNWAYAGYSVLKETRSFTKTDDQDEIMGGFMRETNPVVAFIEETQLQGKIDRTALYNQYTFWCREAGHEPMSRTKFIRSFKQTAQQVRLKFSEEKYVGNRYFYFPAAVGAL